MSDILSKITREPWLIQRCKQRIFGSTGSTTGFDAHFQCDYMGSAEFEFGALPKSLKQMTKNFDKLDLFQVKGVKNHEGKGLFVLCLPEVWAEYEAYMGKLLKEEIRLKECSLLKDETTGIDWRGKKIEKDSYSKVDLWWDIINNVMFAYGKDTMKLATKAIHETLEKKRDLISKGIDVEKSYEWVP